MLAPWGYDVQVVLQQVSELPTVCDPYVLILMHLGDGDVLYRWDNEVALYRGCAACGASAALCVGACPQSRKAVLW